MIVKLLGMLDLLCGISIVFNASVPVNVMRALSLALLGKGGLFAAAGDLASYLDVLCAFYMFAITIGFSNAAISAVTAIFLMQKSILTFFA